MNRYHLLVVLHLHLASSLTLITPDRRSTIDVVDDTETIFTERSTSERLSLQENHREAPQILAHVERLPGNTVDFVEESESVFFESSDRPISDIERGDFMPPQTLAYDERDFADYMEEPYVEESDANILMVVGSQSLGRADDVPRGDNIPFTSLTQQRTTPSQFTVGADQETSEFMDDTPTYFSERAYDARLDLDEGLQPSSIYNQATSTPYVGGDLLGRADFMEEQDERNFDMDLQEPDSPMRSVYDMQSSQSRLEEDFGDRRGRQQTQWTRNGYTDKEYELETFEMAREDTGRAAMTEPSMYSPLEEQTHPYDREVNEKQVDDEIASVYLGPPSETVETETEQPFIAPHPVISSGAASEIEAPTTLLPPLTTTYSLESSIPTLQVYGGAMQMPEMLISGNPWPHQMNPYPVFQSPMMQPMVTRPPVSYGVAGSCGGGGCGGCCSCEQPSCAPEVRLRPIPFPVEIPQYIPQAPIMIVRQPPPIHEIDSRALTTTQVTVKETVMEPITTVIESVVVDPIVSRSEVEGPFKRCVPTGRELTSINNLLMQSLTPDSIPDEYEVLLASRRIDDADRFRVVLRSEGLGCRTFDLESPLGEKAWSLDTSRQSNCQRILALERPPCEFGSF